MDVSVRTWCRSATMLLSVTAIAACGGPPSSTGSPDPTPSMTLVPAAPSSPPSPRTAAVPSAVPRPPVEGPIPEEESLPTTASIERDGIRLSMELSANPMYAGKSVPFSITLENTGDEQLRWTNDGCDTNVSVVGRMADVLADSAVAVDEDLVAFRDWFREGISPGEPIWLRASRSLGPTRRSSGCADLGIGRSLDPGERATQRYAWDGWAAPRLGLPPNGPATWSASFGRWWRGDAEDEDPGAADRELVLELPASIVGGRRSDAISPAQAIDAALSHQPFTDWLVTRPVRNGADAVAEYDPATGLWVVGLLTFDDSEYGDPAEGTLHAVLIDPVTARVVTEFEAPAPHLGG
jgi:hypothetical protein